MANTKCKECGCDCRKCNDHDVQLHLEIENLKQKLLERENHIVTMETNFLNEANKFPSGEIVALRDELLTWQDKYKRLYDAHRRVQRVNQGLEDKLLKLVDVCETDKTTLTKDVATLSHKLAEANYAVKKLSEDNDRYKNDLSIAIQFLQCKQQNFVSQKYDSLTPDVQSQVSMFMTVKRKPEERRTPPEVRSIKVPIPTFPPTAMVYSVPKSPKPDRRMDEDVESPQVDIVSAAIMAKVLEERQKERAMAKHCDTCTCSKNLKIIYDVTHHSIGTQTGDYKDQSCIRCNDVINLNQSTTVNLVRQDVPKEANETTQLLLQQQAQHIVKVQPNNFLLDHKSKTTSNNSSILDLNTNSNQTSPKNDLSNPNTHIINESKPYQQDVMFFNVNEKRSPKIENKVAHHHLCDKSSPGYELDGEKADSERNLDRTSTKHTADPLKGPRYCSMRLQTGSKNILLDNTHNNVAPVLYTRSNKPKRDEGPKQHDLSQESLSSLEDKGNISLLSDNSAQNQQRVADWIQSNIDNDLIVNIQP